MFVCDKNFLHPSILYNSEALELQAAVQLHCSGTI